MELVITYIMSNYAMFQTINRKLRTCVSQKKEEREKLKYKKGIHTKSDKANLQLRRRASLLSPF